MHIADVIAVPGSAAYFFDDQAAILAGAQRDGLNYPGTPLTPGFEHIRQPAAAVSVLLVLSDGQVAHGDCVSVQYSGVGGRDPLLDGPGLAARIDDEVAPALRGRTVDRYEPFKALLADFAPLGTAAAYGLSQALLDACARANRCTMAAARPARVGPRHPAGAGAGVRPDRRGPPQRRGQDDPQACRLAATRPDQQPVARRPGRQRAGRLRRLGPRPHPALAQDASYRPILHFDTYATPGLAFDGDLARVTALLLAMEQAARPYALRVEHPVDSGGRAEQIRDFVALRTLLADAARACSSSPTNGPTPSRTSARSTARTRPT